MFIWQNLFSVFFLFSLSALGEFENEPSQSIQASEGGSAVFDLPPISHLTGFLRFEWLLDGNALNVNQEHYYQTLSKDLILLNIPNSFNGNSYRARITHLLNTGYRTSESHDFNVDVSGKISLFTCMNQIMCIQKMNH